MRELMPLDDTPVWTCSSSGFIDDNVFLECSLPLRASMVFRSMPEFDAKIRDRCVNAVEFSKRKGGGISN